MKNGEINICADAHAVQLHGGDLEHNMEHGQGDRKGQDGHDIMGVDGAENEVVHNKLQYYYGTATAVIIMTTMTVMFTTTIMTATTTTTAKITMTTTTITAAT